MTFVTIIKSGLRATIFGFAGLALTVAAQQPVQENIPRNVWVNLDSPRVEDLPHHFRLGVLVGFNIKADFKMSGDFSVSGSQPGQPGMSGLNHIYDDGYVRVDNTGNAKGLTSYWGYNDASQFDPGAQTLTFHSAHAFTASGSSHDQESPQVGLDLAYGGDLFRWDALFLGWEFGFGYLPIGIEDKSPMSATIVRTVHAFSTGGVLPPSAPYNGGPSGIGPLISDQATLLSDDTVAGTITGSRKLDVDLYVVRLGPVLQWEFARQWAMSFGGGPAIGYLDGNLKFNENIVSGNGASGSNSGRIGDSELLFGGYVNATLMYHAVPNGDFYLGVQYMPLGHAVINGSGRESRLDLSGGIYLSAGINWPF